MFWALVLAWVSLFASAALSAELVILEAQADITIYQGPDEVDPGDLVSMVWRVDLDAADTAADPSDGFYPQDFPGIDLIVGIVDPLNGVETISFRCDRLQVEVRNDIADGSIFDGDSYTVGGELCTNEFQDVVELLALTLHDPTGLALDSDAQIIPDLADFGGSVDLPNPILALGCTTADTPPCEPFVTGFAFAAEGVFDLIVLPEPELAPWIAVGAIALLRRRMRDVRG
jgi:hypothetical protein